jgi:hypothetical protein
MALGKKERRFTITIGLIIGVTASSMLVRHALDVKDEQASQKPGNYNSLHSAIGNVEFPPPPEKVKKAVPNGIVVFYEDNRTSVSIDANQLVNSWVIETSGSFRSERLFILAEVSVIDPEDVKFYRASEIYVGLGDTYTWDEFENLLPKEQFRMIGQNSVSSEYIVQIRHFSPSDIALALESLEKLPQTLSVRPSRWIPSR